MEEKEYLNYVKGFIPTCHIIQQKFCSNAVGIGATVQKNTMGASVNICPECGDKKGGRWRRLYSDQCRKKYHQKKVVEQRAKRERTKQICPNCGKEYEPQ